MMKTTLPARLEMSVSGLKLVEDIAAAGRASVMLRNGSRNVGMLLLLRYCLVGTYVQLELSNQIL